jgi:uncharacterized membrane protein
MQVRGKNDCAAVCRRYGGMNETDNQNPNHV